MAPLRAECLNEAWFLSMEDARCNVASSLQWGSPPQRSWVFGPRLLPPGEFPASNGQVVTTE